MKARQMFVYMLLILIFCSFSYAATKVLEWKYEQNLLDTSGSGINGTPYPSSGSEIFSTGVSGYAFESSGTNSSFNNTAGTAILPVLAGDTWTVNVWVCPTGAPGDWQIVWSLGNKPTGSTSCNSRALYSSSEGKIVFTDGKGIGGVSWLSTGVPWTPNVWQMLTTTYDGTKVRIYKNGYLIGSKTWTFEDAPGEVRIPTCAAWKPLFFAGKFDEFTVWDGAMTQEEIVDLIIPGILPEVILFDKVVHYTMDDAYNGEIADHSGHSRTGELYGFTSPIESWEAVGMKGKGLLFEGGQAIIMPDNNSISENTAFSVAFWFKGGMQPYNTAFYSEASAASPASRLIIRGDAGTDGTIKAYSKNKDDQTQFSITYNASEYLNKKFWHHLALTTDSDIAKLYIDGEVVATSSVSNIGLKMNDMTGHIGYSVDSSGGHFLGEWDKTYLDDFQMFIGALSQQEVQALMAEGNIDQDLDVDFRDFAVFADEWQNDTTSVPASSLVIGDMEGSLTNWSVTDMSLIAPYFTGTGTISSTSNAYAGSQALQWNYDLPARVGGNYSSIQYDFGTGTNLTSYDAVKLYMYRHEGNVKEEPEGVLYIKFYDQTQSLKAEAIVGGPNCVVDPIDEWEQWHIDLNFKLRSGVGDESVDKSVLNSIRYIVIGCGSENPDARTGIIDIDEFAFVKYPVCSQYQAGDVYPFDSKDCKVDLRDLTAFVEEWLIGTE